MFSLHLPHLSKSYPKGIVSKTDVYLAQSLHDGLAVSASGVVGEAMQGHVHEGVQSAGPLLSNDSDLLAPQEGLVGTEQRHGLVQGLGHHRPVTCLLLQQSMHKAATT